MKFHKTRLFTAVIAAGLFSIPFLVNAADLSFANDTNADLSVKINKNCSNQFGIIPQHTEKLILDNSLQDACKYNPSSCTVEVFNTANCTGTHIETIVLDTKDGVLSLEGGDNNNNGNQQMDLNFMFPTIKIWFDKLFLDVAKRHPGYDICY